MCLIFGLALALPATLPAKNMYDVYGANYNRKQDFEAEFSNADYKQLDTFEANRLAKADAIFRQTRIQAAALPRVRFVHSRISRSPKPLAVRPAAQGALPPSGQ